MKKNILLLFFTLGLAFNFQAQDLYYSEDDSTFSRIHYLQDIEVTAEKREQKLQEMPLSVSTIPSLKLEENGVTSLRDLTFRVPNLYMPDYGMRLSAPIYIRGIGSKINSPAVGLYVDGVPYFEKSVYDFDLFDVKQVEVLRGPQGTVFGRNTLGGIINVVTKKPEPVTSGSLSLEVGNYNSQRHHLAFTSPLWQDKLFFRASAAYSQRDGYTQNNFKKEDVDYRENMNGRMQLRFIPNASWDIQLSGYGDVADDGGYPYARVDIIDENPFVADFDGPGKYDRDLYGSSLKVGKTFNASQLDVVFSYQGVDETQKVDQDFTTVDKFGVNKDLNQDLLNAEISLRSIKKRSFSWLVGVAAFQQDLQTDICVNYGSYMLGKMGGLNQYHTFKTNNTLSQGAAGFFQVSWLAPKTPWELTLGARLDYEHKDLDYRALKFVNDNDGQLTDEITGDKEYWKVLPKFALKYHLNSYANMYLTISEGYRPGGFNTSIDEGQLDQLHYEPEFSRNYEIGSKCTSPSGKWSFNAAVFFIEWENMQVYQPRPSGQGSILTNAGEAESYGAEMELFWNPIKHLTIDLMAGYSHSTYKEYEKGEQDFSGNYVPLVPRFTGNVDVTYEVPLRSMFCKSLKVNGSVQALGDQYFNDINGLTQNGYGLVNGRVSLLMKKNIELAFWGKNILDKNYYSYMFDLTGTPGFAQMGAPRTFGGQVQFKF